MVAGWREHTKVCSSIGRSADRVSPNHRGWHQIPSVRRDRRGGILISPDPKIARATS